MPINSRLESAVENNVSAEIRGEKLLILLNYRVKNIDAILYQGIDTAISRYFEPRE